MICPYCSTDMEPIELNGKMFCSNCGLTVGSTTPAQTDTQSNVIRHLDSPAADINNSTSTVEEKPVEPKAEETLESLATKFSPLKNEASLGAKNEPGFYDKTSLDSLGPVKNDELPISALTEAPKQQNESSIDDIEAKPVIPDEVLLALEPKSEEPNEPNQENLAPQMSQENPKILMSILSEEPNDIRVLEDTDNNVEIPNKKSGLSEKIKEVEELGSAGILLDIISDEAIAKQKENEISAMTEATSLLDKITIGDDKVTDKDKTKAQNNIKGASEFSPKGAKKVKVNILDNSAVNPITHPELEAGPEELDLPAPSNIDDPSSTDPETFDDQNNFLTEESPENIDFSQSINTDKTKNIEEIFGKISEESNNIDLDEDDETPKEVTTDIDEGAESSKTDESEPETTKKLTTKEVKAALGNETELTEADETSLSENISSNQNSEHLMKYFSNIISHEKGKKKKLTKTQKRKRRNTIIFCLLFVALFIFAAVALSIYENYQSKPIAVETTKRYEAETTEQATLPTEIPIGYEKDVTIVDSQNNSYTTEYIFSADRARKLVLKEEKSDQVEQTLNKYIAAQTGKYEIKDIEGKTYTIFENGSIAWTTDNKLFTITAIGETYKDMVEKMALSMEK